MSVETTSIAIFNKYKFQTDWQCDDRNQSSQKIRLHRWHLHGKEAHRKENNIYVISDWLNFSQRLTSILDLLTHRAKCQSECYLKAEHSGIHERA